MADNETPADQVRSVMAKNLEQAHAAIDNYFQFVEKSISSSPLGATDRTKAFRNYVERSVAASFELSDKILRAKDLQDVLRIQTEFFQKQLQAFRPRFFKAARTMQCCGLCEAGYAVLAGDVADRTGCADQADS